MSKLNRDIVRGLTVAFVAATILTSTVSPSEANAENADPVLPKKWGLTIFGGIGTDGGIEDFPGLQTDFNDAYMLGGALSREIARWDDLATLELEAQAVKHFVKQHHAEFNFLLGVRWKKFPWNDHLKTSVAVGEGISLASSVPTIERERSPDKTSTFLNYLMLELELAPPREEHWSFVTRIHHRSGVFGTYNGVSKGSNFLAAGLRYRF